MTKQAETKKLRIYCRRVVGNSMLPYLKQGNIVIGISKNTYKVGDIVIAKIASKDVIKRVLSIKNDNFDIRGDNIKASTDSRNYGLIDKKSIIAKAYKVI